MSAVMFDELVNGQLPIYEAGTHLGWRKWDLQSNSWEKVEIPDSVAKKGYGSFLFPLSFIPVSRELASDEVRKMRESLPSDRGMIVAWERTEPGFLRLSAGSFELADLDYGPPPDWVKV